jgi:hypothetical protein
MIDLYTGQENTLSKHTQNRHEKFLQAVDQDLKEGQLRRNSFQRAIHANEDVDDTIRVDAGRKAGSVKAVERGKKFRAVGLQRQNARVKN